MSQIKFHHPKATEEHLGLIPMIISPADPRPAAEQVREKYRHGGGWNPMRGFTFNPDDCCLEYQGDEPTRALAEWMVGVERVIVFEHAWVAVIQPDGSYEVSRMD